MRKEFIIFIAITLPGITALGFFNPHYFWIHLFLLPITLLGLYDMYQSKHSIKRNYPIIGRGRYFMELIRPKVYQYFIESDTDGTPIGRTLRSIVYQRSKEEISTVPFGTQLNVYAPGYEWINHSFTPSDPHLIDQNDLRVLVGGANCKKPYLSSVLNISAMSFGSLSSNAILALNKGAKEGKFAHNTGEGGISPYHLEHQGDLIWQIGTGYFGCREKNGTFSKNLFKEKTSHSSIKMIELKLSQGAKPAHGGILPAIKNTEEIAKIRGVEKGTTVNSPSFHTAFKDPRSMLEFIQNMRELSGGLPIGIKFCMGNPHEFKKICQAIIETGISPDYLAIDGGEGGTGAAPLEFSDSIGMPGEEGIILVNNILLEFGLRDKMKIISSGKYISGFHLIKAFSLGADITYMARAMMLSLGCIQSLLCNKNTCPTGVATQNPYLVTGLVVADKYKRVANFHRHTLQNVAEILAASGLNHPKELNRGHIWRRVSLSEIKNLKELYPYPNTVNLS